MDRHRPRQESLELSGVKFLASWVMEDRLSENLRLEFSHECSRKACASLIPHAQDLIYEALNDWRLS